MSVAEALDRAAEALRGAERVALACHVNPDADALGSMLGLAVFLRARGKETVCSYGNEPFERPRWVQVLPGADLLVEPRAFPASPEVMATLDCASMERLGNLAPAASRARTLVWIDHHATNEGLGTISVIDPSASSSAELTYRLMQRLGGEIPADAAACLYAGLVTDTGRFQYDAASPETLHLAAELRRYRFDHARLAQALFEDNSLPYLRLLGTALHRLTLVPEADLVWTYLTQADIVEAGVEVPETDDLIDVVRTAREADVAAVVKQTRDGRFKVSIRSKGATDLAALASRFGGGGHRLAAGYTSGVGLEQTVAQLVDALRQARAGAGPS